MFNYLIDFCSSHNLLSDRQFGFRPGVSTETALISSLDFVHSSLDNGASSVCCIFFDLSKAFNTVLHIPLLQKLSSLPLPSSLISWFHHYLLNRTQQVFIPPHSSSSMFYLVYPKAQSSARFCSSFTLMILLPFQFLPMLCSSSMQTTFFSPKPYPRWTICNLY